MLRRTMKYKKIKSSMIVISIILVILVLTIKNYSQNDNITNNQESIEKENLEKNVNEDNTNYSGADADDTWTEIEESRISVDGNKILPNGMTLGDVKGLIDTQRDFCKREGMSEEETTKLLEQIAKDMGTSLSEIKRIIVSETPVVVENPSIGGGSSGGNSGGGSSSGGSTGYVPPVQPSGGAVSPQFEGYGVTGDITTEQDPNFNLEAN